MVQISYKNLLVILVSFIIQTSQSARILGIFCFPSHSHHIVFRSLMEELANEGHDIVTVTANPARYNTTFKGSIKEIDVEACSYNTFATLFDRSKLTPTPSFMYKVNYLFRHSLYILSKTQLEHPKVRELLENKAEHFDLIFVQSLCQGYIPLAYQFKAPYIIFSTTIESFSEVQVTGKPYNPIVYPNFLSNYIGTINLWEKIDAICLYLWQEYLEWHYNSKLNELVKTYIGSNLPSIEDALKQVALVFININPIVGGIRPNVPSVIYLGGVHIKPKKELPKELKSYLDNSTQGVIYMSLGSNTKSATLSNDVIKIFTNVFSQLPYNVIWKWEAEQLPSKPDNVLISKWFPQRDLLGHKNVKAFIMQGGQQSLDEAIVNKVPIVGIPFVVDQHRNIRHMTRLGVCQKLQVLTMDEESLRKAIINIVEDKRYKENMELLSKEVNDNQKASLQTGVWWTEYVLRNKGTLHLHAPTISFFEYLMLDLIWLPVLTIATVAVITKIMFYKLSKTKIY